MTTKIDPTCPLFAVRRRYCDETDDYDLHVERCGEPLGVEWTSWGELDPDGLAVEELGVWRVECHGGHGLALLDSSGAELALLDDLRDVLTGARGGNDVDDPCPTCGANFPCQHDAEEVRTDG